MLKAQKIGKGIGEDLIESEIAHFFPIAFAILLTHTSHGELG